VIYRCWSVLPVNELPSHNQFMGTVRAGLGDDRHAAATVRGADMTSEQITTFALGAVDDLL